MAGNHRLEDNEPSEEEEELECDECGRTLDYEEAECNDGMCWDCAKGVRVYQVRQRLPPNYSVLQVTGNHSKPCSDCGTHDFDYGDYYVYDSVQPRGTDKYCLDCAEARDWGYSDDEEDDEDKFAYLRQLQSARQRQDHPPVFAPAGGIPGWPDHPTAGSLHIGGLSSAMFNPAGMQMKTRNCERGVNGRRCQGKIQSFTEDGFSLATCSICLLPSVTRKEGELDRKQAASATKRGDGGTGGEGTRKRQRV